jgi:hypothetical protein
LAIYILVVAALVVLIFSLVLFMHAWRDLRRQGLPVAAYRPWHNQFFKRSAPDYALRRQQEATGIADWMTFDYLNRVFGLPGDYLKTSLNITDKKYPELAIKSWATQTKQDSQKLTEQIKILVMGYQGTATSTTPLSTPTPSTSTQNQTPAI